VKTQIIYHSVAWSLWSVCLRHADNGRTAVSWWLFLSEKSAFGLAMTLTFDFWSWKHFHQCLVIRWIFTPSFIQIRSLSIQRYYHLEKIKTDGRTDEWTQPRTTDFDTFGRRELCHNRKWCFFPVGKMSH